MKKISDAEAILSKQMDEIRLERDRLLVQIKELEKYTQDNPDLFLDYIEKTDSPFYQITSDLSKFVYVNGAAEKFWGVSRHDLYHDAFEWFKCVHPDDREKLREYLLNLQTKGASGDYLEYRIKKPDGSVISLQDRAIFMKSKKNKQECVLGFIVDITKYVSIEKNKLIYEQVIYTIRKSKSIESTIDEILKIICLSYEWDEGEIWIYDNSANSFYCITFYQRVLEEAGEFYQLACNRVIGASADFQGYVIQKNHPVLIDNLNKSNEAFSERFIKKFKRTSALGIPIVYQNQSLGVLNFFNQNKKRCTKEEIDLMIWVSSVLGEIIQHNLSDKKLIYVTSHNELTGLLNRGGLESSLQHLIGLSDTNIHAVIMLDIDRFKLINENYNFEVGDIILKELALRFREGIGDHAKIIAALGGDVFAFVAANIKAAEQIKPIIEKILCCLQRPFFVKNNEIHLQASVGVSIYPYDGLDVYTLLKSSDIALKHAKSRGGNTIQFSTKSLQDSVSNAIRIENGLRRALVDKEFKLYYQPKVDLKSGAIVGLEALLRWDDPIHGIQMPKSFLYIAQQTDLIIYIGEWVLLEIAFHFPLVDFKIPVSINVDARQLKKGYDFMTFIQQLLNKMSIRPELLELEVTESQVMEDALQAVNVILPLQRSGVSIAIDDFGSGYSSYAYLQTFKPNRIKIDKSFIDALPNNKDAAAIVKSIIALCHNLNMKVTAEGVANVDQVKFLMQEKCDEAQGSYFSDPLSLYELKTLISSREKFKLPK